MRYLHIGCGTNILPKPFENIDGRGFEGVDHISSASDLKQFSESVVSVLNE